jgi:hypothetical protein
MPGEWIIRVILLSVVHWVLAGFMLQDMASRPKVFGGHKAFWVIAVVIIPCLGSLLYLAFHPQMLYPD